MNKETLRLDYFIDPEIKVYQHPDHFHFNTDTRLLAQFMHIKSGECLLDIGTNNGVLLLYAALFHPRKLIGVEILPGPFEVAQFNMAQFVKVPYELINQPIQEVRIDPVDVICSNPPFFKQSEQHPHTKIDGRAQGRFEIHLDLDACIASASRLLKSNGRFYFVHRPDRIFEILIALDRYHFGLKRIQFVYDSRKKGAKSVLIEARKEAACKTLVEEPIFL